MSQNNRLQSQHNDKRQTFEFNNHELGNAYTQNDTLNVKTIDYILETTGDQIPVVKILQLPPVSVGERLECLVSSYKLDESCADFPELSGQ